MVATFSCSDLLRLRTSLPIPDCAMWYRFPRALTPRTVSRSSCSCSGSFSVAAFETRLASLCQSVGRSSFASIVRPRYPLQVASAKFFKTHRFTYRWILNTATARCKSAGAACAPPSRLGLGRSLAAAP